MTAPVVLVLDSTIDLSLFGRAPSLGAMATIANLSLEPATDRLLRTADMANITFAI